jgi:hypothetical protein
MQSLDLRHLAYIQAVFGSSASLTLSWSSFTIEFVEQCLADGLAPTPALGMFCFTCKWSITPLTKIAFSKKKKQMIEN